MGKLNFCGYLILRFFSYSRNSRKFDACKNVFYSNPWTLDGLETLIWKSERCVGSGQSHNTRVAANITDKHSSWSKTAPQTSISRIV